MGDTSISWTDKTWNCVRGCSRVSEGCRNCYAERQAMRFAGPGQPYQGLVTKRLKVINADERDRGNYVEAHWTGKVRFVAEHLCDPLSWRTPCRVFVNSMSDVFHESLTNEQIAAIFGVMAAANRHTFQVLTKRADRMEKWFAWIAREAKACNAGNGMTPAARCFVEAQRAAPDVTQYLSESSVVSRACGAPWPLPNVWIGVSTENQDTAEDRIPHLLMVPAAIRFISAEPLLGAIDLFAFVHGQLRDRSLGALGINRPMPGLDWVIAGAESGPRSRACDYRWIRQLRDQCWKAGVAFFLKQAAITYSEVGTPNWPLVIAGGEGSKKKAGGIFERPYLDGRQHLEFPR